MLCYVDEPATERRLVPYRDLERRRERIRSAALRVIDEHADLEEEIDSLRRYYHYYELCHKDRDVYRQEWSDLRVIVEGWRYASSEDVADFRAGLLAPSGLAARINRARAARS